LWNGRQSTDLISRIRRVPGRHEGQGDQWVIALECQPLAEADAVEWTVLDPAGEGDQLVGAEGFHGKSDTDVHGTER
jgi:hypothetical protein